MPFAVHRSAAPVMKGKGERKLNDAHFSIETFLCIFAAEGKEQNKPEGSSIVITGHYSN
jgi:hypothetical protein